ncbi:hypothetical protein [Fibrobacter sp. UWR2]|uniref:hypothetical protein n=1 Tax=Fibrobacter sp. UWR2 TaxID=1964352 RepID=UPI000B635B0C|nr:hypothetical protein [Fibrobacter sp. UWR2]OWV01035.1 hypothetical protein B7994_04445 [Fibrobacter sp. UWR2]
MKKIPALIVVCLLLLASLVFAYPAPAARNGFSNMNVTTEYSELLKEKNARNDSLLPALDGDKAFAEVLRLNPNFWSLGSAMEKEGSLVTKLNAQIVFIDGIREDPFCELLKGSKSDASTWNVRIGVDFVSGGSNTVHIHVQQCLDYVRDQLGYAIKQGDKIIVVPPKKVLDKLRESEIPDAIDLDMQQTLLKAHEEVELDGKCPKNIEAYIILMNVYNQVKDKKMDYVVINDQLNKQRNGGSRVQSCAFSREWNKRYQESASFECDIDHDRCLYRQENDGNSEWSINYEQDRFEYINKKFLFFNLNPKSIHKGGSMLDLRLIRLSTKLYLEAYINLKGEPVTLGLIIVPGDKTIEDYDDGEEDDGTMVED